MGQTTKRRRSVQRVDQSVHLTGNDLLTWWTWILRNPTDRDEPNPLKQAGSVLRKTGGTRPQSGTSIFGSTIPDVLAMEMQEQSCGRRTKAYNPDPQVADYKNGEEALRFMMGEDIYAEET